MSAGHGDSPENLKVVPVLISTCNGVRFQCRTSSTGTGQMYMLPVYPMMKMTGGGLVLVLGGVEVGPNRW